MSTEPSMFTPDNLIEASRARVAGYLAEYEDAIDFNDGSYAIPHGSSSVMVVVRPYTDTDTMVEFMAQCVTGATVTPELLTWLLRKNVELHLGSFGLLFDNTIVYSYAVTGGSIDKSEFDAAVKSVAVIADHYDDEIVAMAGGKRFADLDA
jgi:Putative bacterial sensory transduction regulator